MAPDPLREEVERIRWFHSIQLRDDLVTPGYQPDTAKVFPRIGMPDDLSGKTVLDVGTWDGFYAFQAERRGADRVVATDQWVWNAPGWSDAGFRCAHRALGSSVEQRDLDVLDHSPETIGTFDVVLFLGVLYHMRHPLLALERMRSVTKERLILETHVETLLGARNPLAVFYPGTELNNDPSNWWGPNIRCVEELLRAAGFARVDLVYPTSRAYTAARWGYKRGRGIVRRVRYGEPIDRHTRGGRAAFHAWV